MVTTSADMASTNENDAHDGSTHSSIRVPSFNLQHSNESLDGKKSQSLIPRSDFERAYGPHQALHIRGYTPPNSESSSTSSIFDTDLFRASDVLPLFDSINDEDKASWCMENDAIRVVDGVEKPARIVPSEFLDIANTNQRGYCSFLVQHSKTVMEGLLLNRLPMVHLPVADASGGTMKVNYGPCLWLFFGKNCAESTLSGRPEHTDSVANDGTWHYQLSGTKIWRLRPTTKLFHIIEDHERQQKSERSVSGTKRKIDDAVEGAHVSRVDQTNNFANPEDSCIEVECRQGDIIFLNTRLWWHSTLIPPQDVPSISYARDIYFLNTESLSNTPCKNDRNEDVEDGESNGGAMEKEETVMTNVDGTYATEDIAAETILFTERNLPNCELHRSKTDPNCQVIELEDDVGRGESYMAVVTLRDIKAGEFFSVLESDEDEEDEFDSGEEDIEWNEGEDEEDRCITAPK